MTVRGAMSRNHMPTVMELHPNPDVAEAFNGYTQITDDPPGYLANAADQVYRHYSRATQALGDVMARRYELREPGASDLRPRRILDDMRRSAGMGGVDPNDTDGVLDFAMRQDGSESTMNTVEMIRRMLSRRDPGGYYPQRR